MDRTAYLSNCMFFSPEPSGAPVSYPKSIKACSKAVPGISVVCPKAIQGARVRRSSRFFITDR